MDVVASVCLAFPPDVPPADDKAYDKAARAHASKLSQLLKSGRQDIITSGVQLLEMLDPAVNSLSYITILHTLCLPGLAGSRDVLLDKLVIFMLTFDARQIRYGGHLLLDLIIPIGNGLLLPPPVAVEVLVSAILRLDPSGSMLTTTHTLLAKLAYSTNNIEPAIPVVDKNIVFYPGMPDRNQPEYLCDMSLSPPSYISKGNGLTNALKATAVLEYDLLCGMMYCARRDWAKAYAAFERVITYPTRDQGTSKIMVEAYKKWILVGLLHSGRLNNPPSYTGQGANKMYNVLGQQYKELASLFEKSQVKELKTFVDEHTQAWQEDGNVGLMREVIASYQMWQILNLQQVYSKISIPEIRKQTTSAQTGKSLEVDEDIVTLIQNMVISGMLHGVIEKNDDGTAFLTFLPPSTAQSEAEFAKEIAASAFRLKALKGVFKATNERLSTNRDYLRHLIRVERNKDKDEPGYGNPFESQVDDEDLMGGITSTA